eukprot:PhM_4_TR14592/c0_g1_i1/m.97896
MIRLSARCLIITCVVSALAGHYILMSTPSLLLTMSSPSAHSSAASDYICSIGDVTTETRRRRVAILTMNVAFGRDWIYPMSFRNKLAYAQQHGYDFIVE